MIFSALILFILLIPTKSYPLAFVSYVFFLSVFIILRFKKQSFKLVIQDKIYLCFFIFALLLAMSKSIVYVANDLSDLIDVGRFLLFFIIAIAIPRNYKITSFLSVMVIVVTFDFFVTIIQFFNLSLFGLRDVLIGFYNLEKIRPWIDGSLGVSRAPGIFPGFGEHAAFLLFSFYLFSYAITEKIGRFNFLLIVMCISSLAMNQSKTGIVAFFVSLSVVAIVSVFRRKISIKWICFSSFVLLFVLSFVDLTKLSYITNLLSRGLSGGSVDERFLKWEYLLSYIEQPVFLLFGTGRTVLEGFSVFDNDFLYILSVHGIILAFIFYFSIVFPLVNSRINELWFCYFYQLTALSILGLGTVIFTFPLLVVLLVVLGKILQRYEMSGA